MKSKIAAAMPGKIGDSLYSLATLRKIYDQTGEKIDFYTSEYCLPMKRLFEYQSCINSFNIKEDYVIRSHDMGTQPWNMGITGDYHHIYELGFEHCPNCAIPDYVCKTALGEGYLTEVKYEYPEIKKPYKNYVVLSSKGFTSFYPIFLDVMRELKSRNIDSVMIGSVDEHIGGNVWNELGLDMLETVSILSGARGYVGIFSSMLVLANGFNYPKVCIHQGFNDMSHAVQSESNIYLNMPTAIQVVESLGL